MTSTRRLAALAVLVASCAFAKAPAENAAPRESPWPALLASARGLPPAICALAIDGVRTGGWGGGPSAPALPLDADVRAQVRALRRSTVTTEDARGLIAGLGADDACERQLAATLIGRAEDKALAQQVGARLGATSPAERGGRAGGAGVDGGPRAGGRGRAGAEGRRAEVPRERGLGARPHGGEAHGARGAGAARATRCRPCAARPRRRSGTWRAASPVGRLSRVLAGDADDETRRVAAGRSGRSRTARPRTVSRRP
jgi:hypothetical protein